MTSLPSLRRRHLPAFSLLMLCLLGNSSAALHPSPVQAAFPAYNGKIVLENWVNGWADVSVMDQDGSKLVSLGLPNTGNASPIWSPDGTKIAFSSTRNGYEDVYTMNADGSNQTRLTNDPAVDYWPAWSPDGKKILFSSNRDGNYHVYVMDADGSNQTNLTPSNIWYNAAAVWSPDGQHIVFVSTRDGNQEIYRMRSDGSEVARLTHNAVPDDYPEWSPDGQYIATARFNADWDSSVVVVMDVNGHNEQELDLHGDGIEIVDDISWSNDGQFWLITGYHDNIWGSWDQYRVNTDGSNLTRLTTNEVTGYGHLKPLPNTKPITYGDTLALQVNSSASSDVLVNDSDEEALSGTNLTISNHPSHGTASVESGKVRYTPATDYVGTDQLTYQICDSFLLDQKCATEVLAITVQAPDAPAIPTVTKVGTVELNGHTKLYYTGHRPTFAGTADPGSTITIEVHSDPIVFTTTADTSGNWSATPTQDIPNGEHQVLITATKDGSTSEPLTFVLGINVGLADTGAPILPLLGAGLVALVSAQVILRRRIA